MQNREPIGHVIRIGNGQIVVAVETDYQTRVFAHAQGVAQVGQPGDVIGSAAGDSVIVLMIISLAFAEAAESSPFGRSRPADEPLQQFITRPLGYLRQSGGGLIFEPGVLQAPFLGAAVFPLSDAEISEITRPPISSREVYLGQEARDRSRAVKTDLDALLGRHFAVVGSTGQGKTHFIVNRIRDLKRYPNSRIVVFDINGEYANAFIGDPDVQVTRFTKDGAGDMRIPYVALGFRGLVRLLLPSEKTQLPALRLAVDSLPYLESDGIGARLTGHQDYVHFDDCRIASREELTKAWSNLEVLRNTPYDLDRAPAWPHMRALSCLVADAIALGPHNRGQLERSGFHYGNAATLVHRIQNSYSDRRFREVINEHPPAIGGEADMEKESSALISRVFGDFGKRTPWRVNIVDLSNVAVDLLSYVLGALLEQYADAVFTRGPGVSPACLLILEEAHHYLRSVRADASDLMPPMAYERLAKEGRKFGISMGLSTQRPSELSETVLSQCGTLFVFRLTNERDKQMVHVASNVDAFLFQDLSMLQRGEYVAAGAAVNFPIRLISSPAVPPPKSADAPFAQLWQGKLPQDKNTGIA